MRDVAVGPRRERVELAVSGRLYIFVCLNNIGQVLVEICTGAALELSGTGEMGMVPPWNVGGQLVWDVHCLCHASSSDGTESGLLGLCSDRSGHNRLLRSFNYSVNLCGRGGLSCRMRESLSLHWIRISLHCIRMKQ